MPGLKEAGDYFEGIDWTRTRAYTFGLGGIYLNLRAAKPRHRHARRRPPPESRTDRSKLTGLTDAETGEIAIRNMLRGFRDLQRPLHRRRARPDHRLCARLSCLPGAPPSAKSPQQSSKTTTNPGAATTAWIPPLVPGVLFSNRKLTAEDPGIEDMAPTALNLFGIAPPRGWKGKSLLDLTYVASAPRQTQ